MEGFKNKQMIITTWISIIILSLPASLASSLCKNTVVVREGDDKWMPDVCVRKYLTKDCAVFSRTLDMSLLPEDSMRGKTVPRPDDFVVTQTFYTSPSSNKPGLHFSWKSPSSARDSIKGFYLRIVSRETNHTECRIFSIRHPDDPLEFSYEIPVLFDTGPHFNVKIYSLPLSSNPRSTIVTVNMRSPFPADWKASVAVTPCYEEKSIDVHFSIPKRKLGFSFTNYTVRLARVNLDRNNYFLTEDVYIPEINPYNPSAGHARFTNVTLGDVYQASIQVMDPFRNQDEKCLCYRTVTFMLRPKRVCENSCAVSKSAEFDLKPELNAVSPLSSTLPPSTHPIVTNGASTKIPDVNDITTKSLLYNIIVPLLTFWYTSLWK